MQMIRKKFSSEFKAKVALEAIKGQKTIPEISAQYKVHSTQITKWKQKVINELPGIFSNSHEKESKNQEQQINELYQQIGKLQVENDFLKKAVYQR
jgi:transposase-like protein